MRGYTGLLYKTRCLFPVQFALKLLCNKQKHLHKTVIIDHLWWKVKEADKVATKNHKDVGCLFLCWHIESSDWIQWRATTCTTQLLYHHSRHHHTWPKCKPISTYTTVKTQAEGEDMWFSADTLWRAENVKVTAAPSCCLAGSSSVKHEDMQN